MTHDADPGFVVVEGDDMSTQDDTMALSASQMIGDYIGVFFVAFVISIVAVPCLRWLAVRNGIVDHPDSDRKLHAEPVAYLGGVAIFLGWFAGVIYSASVVPVHFGEQAVQSSNPRLPFALIFGASVITLTVLIDDIYKITPRVKMGGQFMAAAALAWSSQNLGTELVIDLSASVGLSVSPMVAYILGAALIAIFVVGGCNSMNFIDGLDGLAAGVTGIVFLGLLFIAAYLGVELASPLESRMPIVLCLAALGCLAGFLPYNFNPANIYMGDAGSLLLGYLSVSTILLFADAPGGGPMLVTAAMLVFALPITDMTMAIARRFLKGDPLYKPDNRHIHHKVLNTFQRLELPPNPTVKLTVLTMYLIAVVFAVLGCSLVYLRWRYILAVFFAVFGFIVVGAYKSGRRYRLLDQSALSDAQPPVPSTDSPSDHHAASTDESPAPAPSSVDQKDQSATPV